MTLKFYMDEHISRHIVRELRKRGIDVLRAQEDGRMSTDDLLILNRATELSRVMFTSDDDFLKEAKLRQVQGKQFSGVVYIHQTKINIGKIVDDLELIAKAYDPKDMKDRVEYLPL